MTAQLHLDLRGWRLEERVSRHARRVRIEIRSADQVVLVIPQRCSRKLALAFLHSRTNWIQRKLSEQRLHHERAPVSARRLLWDGSDRVPLRGQGFSLQLRAASQFRFHVEQTIVVSAPVARLGDRSWLTRRLREALKQEARCDASALIEEEALRLGVAVGALRIADQKSLWGSCGARGVVSLNWRLVMAPPEVFRYVVIHELAHLLHRNHSARFWAVVERRMPDFGNSRRWLREHGAQLHAVLARDDG